MVVKKKIALISDVHNWAFENIARQIIKNLKEEFDFTLFFFSDYIDQETKLLKTEQIRQKIFCEQKFDLVHFLWRINLIEVLEDNDILAKIKTAQPNLKVTTSVYDHVYLKKKEVKKNKIIFNIADGYTVCSERLNKIYSKITDYSKPSAIIQDGVDTNLFYPKNLKRFEKIEREIVCGWVGNSKWFLKGKDNKGLKTIIEPVIESLKKDDYPIKVELADKSVRFTPLSEMADFYKKIDIYICASAVEGTPNPVLEAMACGVPVISTDVGIIPEVFGKLQKQFIIKRSKIALKKVIKYFIKNPQIFKELSNENLVQIKKFTRNKESLKWKKFFNSIIDKA